MIRSVSQVALALTVILLLLPMLALAQPSDYQKLRDAAIKSWRGTSAPAAPASSASAPAYTKADITRDTPCGASGIGEVWGGPRRGTIEYREGKPGVRVTEEGFWAVGCKMPTEATAKAFATCRGDRQVATWTVGEHTCSSDIGSSDPASPSRRQALRHDHSQALQQWTGPMRGMLIERCRDGQRVQVLARCAPATECDTVVRINWGGTVYSYDARPRDYRVPLGVSVQAVAANGATLRLQCDAGTLRAAPHCVAGQEVTRRRTWERTTYRYAGPPVAPGALVRADEVLRVDMRTEPATVLAPRQRYIMSRCQPDGGLQ